MSNYRIKMDSATSIVHKFGRAVVGTTFGVVAFGGTYPMPQPAAATTLRIKAGGHANDTAAGTGAQEITLVGLDETGAEVTETLATAGALASGATTATFIRLYRAYVSVSGGYATAAQGSHYDDIVIENGAGTADWLTIDATDYARGQSEVACYTVPSGKKTAYISSIKIKSDSSKVTTAMLMQREGVTDAAAPYSAMREVIQLGGLAGELTLQPETPLGPFPAGTDLIWLAKEAATTGEIDIDFEILLV